MPVTIPNPVLSVIIPCFNHGEFLVEAIASVEAYQGNNYEIIIVNDGSTEVTTKAILDKFKQHGYCVIDQVNQGLAQARNHGIKCAQGQYILPLDSDNKIRPAYIERGIDILAKFPDVGIVYGDVEFFGGKIGRWELPDFDLPRLMLSNYIDACAVFRKSVWQDCGGYDPNMPDKLGYEDWDFWLSAATHQWQFYHIPEVMYDYRVRYDSMVQTCKIPENQKRLVHYICTKHADLYAAHYADVIAAKELALFQQINESESLQIQIQEFQLEISRSHHHIDLLKSEIAQLQQEVTQLQTQKTQLKDEIAWMHTSKFWQLRTAWLKLKNLIKIY